MKPTKDDLTQRLTVKEYPRSAGYDPVWMLENLMGPNVIWLTEALSQAMELTPTMRVLDLGCGKAISSIFLAREFQSQIWATDLWIEASENWLRIQSAEQHQRVFPIHAEAHKLPFADNFFDVLVSMDAYHYFGTDDLYLGYISRFIRPGGTLGIIVPGIQQEFNGQLPSHLAPDWEWEWWSFHSPDWWRHHWEKSGLVEVVHADLLPDGWQHWLTWLEVCRDNGYPFSQQEMDRVRADAGRTLGFTRLIARKK